MSTPSSSQRLTRCSRITTYYANRHTVTKYRSAFRLFPCARLSEARRRSMKNNMFYRIKPSDNTYEGCRNWMTCKSQPTDSDTFGFTYDEVQGLERDRIGKSLLKSEGGTRKARAPPIRIPPGPKKIEVPFFKCLGRSGTRHRSYYK